MLPKLKPVWNQFFPALQTPQKIFLLNNASWINPHNRNPDWTKKRYSKLINKQLTMPEAPKKSSKRWRALHMSVKVRKGMPSVCQKLHFSEMQWKDFFQQGAINGSGKTLSQVKTHNTILIETPLFSLSRVVVLYDAMSHVFTTSVEICDHTTLQLETSTALIIIF